MGGIGSLYTTSTSSNGKKHIITTKGYQKYKKFMKQRQINKIIQKTTLHESCDKWTKEV